MSGISTLWRAVDHRLRLVESIYCLKKIPIKDKPSEYLSILEFLGIVRPLMLQKLKELRNAVEHSDEFLPGCYECGIFLEFAWYFLRSTDGITQRSINYLQLEASSDPTGEESDYWLEIHNGASRNWVPHIRGWLPPTLVSDQPMNGWLVLKVDDRETRDELVNRLKGSESEESLDSPGRGRNSHDIHISGDIRGESESLKRLIKLFLGFI